jgi:NADH-quinone oxidoreductase subunit J
MMEGIPSTMENMARLAYLLYLMMILAGGIAAVRCRSLVRSLVGLILTLFGVAGMYLLMAAPFLALMQILIYVGAVSVLIFFAIWLTRDPDGEAGSEGIRLRPRYRIPAAVMAGLLAAGIPAIGIFAGTLPETALKPEVPLERLGQYLVGPYALAFELISVILFSAMIGAVLVGFERRKSG